MSAEGQASAFRCHPHATANCSALVLGVETTCIAGGAFWGRTGGRCSLESVPFSNFSRLLLKNGEHTWGGDVKTFLNGYTNDSVYYAWSNADFQAVGRSFCSFFLLPLACDIPINSSPSSSELLLCLLGSTIAAE